MRTPRDPVTTIEREGSEEAVRKVTATNPRRRIDSIDAVNASLNPPLLIYDGECEFCVRWIARWRKLTGNRVAYRPFQEVEDQFPQISHSAFEASVQLIEPSGAVLEGADAIFRALGYARPQPKILWFRRIPGFMPIARMAYNFIARHRAQFSWLT